MAWRRPGDKSLSGPMMVRLPPHICVTRPQWVKVVICINYQRFYLFTGTQQTVALVFASFAYVSRIVFATYEMDI